MVCILVKGIFIRMLILFVGEECVALPEWNAMAERPFSSHDV